MDDGCVTSFDTFQRMRTELYILWLNIQLAKEKKLGNIKVKKLVYTEHRREGGDEKTVRSFFLRNRPVNQNSYFINYHYTYTYSIYYTSEYIAELYVQKFCTLQFDKTEFRGLVTHTKTVCS